MLESVRRLAEVLLLKAYFGSCFKHLINAVVDVNLVNLIAFRVVWFVYSVTVLCCWRLLEYTAM